MIKRVIKKSALITCIAVASMFAFTNSAFAVELIVYTAVEAEDLKRYAETF
ncbi:MAG: putative 2-aminoethylphosphonate ABC transporter substrate-binding protein, partial [Gammaproteobacteria bacterium]